MNHYLELIGREIGKRSGLDWHEIQVCDPLLIKGIPVDRKLVESCRELFSNRFMISWDGKQVVNLQADESKLLAEAIEHSIEAEVTEIRGMIACPGKVEGEVVIINGEKDFQKMKKGINFSRAHDTAGIYSAHENGRRHCYRRRRNNFTCRDCQSRVKNSLHYRHADGYEKIKRWR